LRARRRVKAFRSTTLRLTAAYTAVFALAVVVLGSVTIMATRTALRRELDSRIQAEALALAQEYRTEGFEGVLQAVRERDRTPGALDYGLKGPSGEPLAGRLAAAPSPDGWSILSFRESAAGDEDADRLRVLAVGVGGGRRLLVGEDLERVSTLDSLILHAFGWAFLGIVVLGASVGFALSREVERRFGEMSAAAEAIIDGDLTRRIPLKGSGDDLDALAATFNRMLDRIAALMESLKQVSSDIAHELRTPLTRLRQKLEASLHVDLETDRAGALESALRDVDAILEVFAALLRIAQIESGARRANFRDVDLSEMAAAVVEAFAPSAEEGGQRLTLTSRGPVMISGDRELLTQMLANLVENGLGHTPSGAAIGVSTALEDCGAVLCVRDDGPGVPAESRTKLFDRFARLEASRSKPGNGLGLALAAAVVRLHGGAVALEDAAPGLLVRVRFPAHGRGRGSALTGEGQGGDPEA
jgi:signal transduction histidine kinase